MAAKTNNKKGFSMAELLAVMAIMAILAAVSVPFLRNYMLNAANDKAKSTLQVIAQGYKNFLADYPNATVSGPIVSTDGSATPCSGVVRTATPANPVGVLFSCNYIQNITLNQPYAFSVGAAACAGNLACMVGTASGRFCSAYSAWIDVFGDLHETAPCS